MALTAAAFLDVIRQPIVLLLVASSLILTSLLPLLAVFMFGEEVRLVRDGACAFQFGIGLLLAGVAAAAALHREIYRGTAAIVLSKPIGRALFFLAKYCGVLLVLAIFCALSAMMAMLSVRLPLPGLYTDWRIAGMLLGVVPAACLLAASTNFFLKRPFVSQAFAFLLPCLSIAFLLGAWLNPDGSLCRFGSLLDWRLAPIALLIGLALAVFAAIALSLSTRLAPIFTLSICGVLFFLGLLADHLLGSAAQSNSLAALAYGAIPNWQDFWLVDALASQNLPLSEAGIMLWQYVVYAQVYALLLIAAALSFGLVSFRHVEIH